jgi:hypothetical protein
MPPAFVFAGKRIIHENRFHFCYVRPAARPGRIRCPASAAVATGCALRRVIIVIVSFPRQDVRFVLAGQALVQVGPPATFGSRVSLRYCAPSVKPARSGLPCCRRPTDRRSMPGNLRLPGCPFSASAHRLPSSRHQGHHGYDRRTQARPHAPHAPPWPNVRRRHSRTAAGAQSWTPAWTASRPAGS